jgi:diacylglycerol kinase (ATP)
LAIYFIVNPEAGDIRGRDFVSLLQAKIKKYKISAEILITRSPQEAGNVAQRLRSRRDALLVACGGDGTVHALLQNLVHSPATLGVIPRGTANDLALAWKIPRDIDKSLELLIQRKPKPIDVIAAARSGAYIAGAGGIGFDTAVVERVAFWKKRWKGLSPYIPGVILTFMGYEFPVVSIKSANRDYYGPVWQVVFTKISRYGRLLKIGDPIPADNGLMEVCIVPRISKSRIARRYALVPFGGFKGMRESSFFTASAVKVASSFRIRYQGDGELIGETPEEFTVVPGALNVIMPV